MSKHCKRASESMFILNSSGPWSEPRWTPSVIFCCSDVKSCFNVIHNCVSPIEFSTNDCCSYMLIHLSTYSIGDNPAGNMCDNTKNWAWFTSFFTLMRHLSVKFYETMTKAVCGNSPWSIPSLSKSGSWQNITEETMWNEFCQDQFKILSVSLWANKLWTRSKPLLKKYYCRLKYDERRFKASKCYSASLNSNLQKECLV